VPEKAGEGKAGMERPELRGVPQNGVEGESIVEIDHGMWNGVWSGGVSVSARNQWLRICHCDAFPGRFYAPGPRP